MIKMGGIICDQCRIVIAATFTDLWKSLTKQGEVGLEPVFNDVILMRRAKKGNILHFCSKDCQEVDQNGKQAKSV